MSEGAIRSTGDMATEASTKVAHVPESKTPDRPYTKEEKSPIGLYLEVKGHPYTADYFEVAEIWNDPDIALEEDVMTIESAYVEKVQGGELEDGPDTFEKFIKEALKATSSVDSPTEIKLAKVAEWYKFMSKLKTIEQNRRRYG